MKPYHRILKHCILELCKSEDIEPPNALETPEQVLEAWEELDENPDYEGQLQDELDALRSRGVETGIQSDKYSRYYENREEAVELNDGTLVGFTYWYGGGKHGEPGALEWAEGAYEVETREEVQVVTIYSRKEEASA